MRTLLGLCLVMIAGCGGSAPPDVKEPAASATASPAAPTDTPAAATPSEAKTESAPAAPAGAQESEAQVLARDLIKSGGRRIGWSQAKKGFAIPTRKRVGESLSLDISFTDESGQSRDTMRICAAGECDEHQAEKAAEAMPKLTARLEKDGYVTVRAIGWPQGRDDLDVTSLRMKIRATQGRIEGVREGKPVIRIGTVRPSSVIAIFISPDSKRLGVISGPSPEAQESDQVFSAFPLP